jgi:endonuclease YncB( thermonuclease family)
MTTSTVLADDADMPSHGVRRYRCPSHLIAICLIGCLLASWVSFAQSLPTSLEPSETGHVVEVIDGDTVLLEDGRQVRLVGIQAPKLALGRPNFPDWPLADESRDQLAAMVMDQTVSLAYGGLSEDRHGRLLAHMVSDDGLWIQGALLGSGMARVYSFADNRTAVLDMLALEEAARADGMGIWALPYYAIRSATEPLDDYVDTFQLVEGQVVDAAQVRGRIFLNFGTDYRTDFTVTVAPDDARDVAASDEDLDAFENEWIRVRGWVGSRNGPQIVVTHPEQIEIIQP